MASDRPSDAADALAGVIGAAIAAGALDREQALEAAWSVLNGPARHAERLGSLIAAATLEALHQTPRTPAQKAAEAFVK